MNKKAVLTGIKIVAFGVVPYLVEVAKKSLNSQLETLESLENNTEE